MNGKGLQVNNILEKLCVDNNFAYVKHDNIKPRQHCNSGAVHLNTAGSKILADNFILALSRQTRLAIIQDDDALIEDISKTESNFEFYTNLPEDTLKIKSDNHDSDENIYFSFLKTVTQNLFSEQLNVNPFGIKYESAQQIIQNIFDIFLVGETKIDYYLPN